MSEHPIYLLIVIGTERYYVPFNVLTAEQQNTLHQIKNLTTQSSGDRPEVPIDLRNASLPPTYVSFARQFLRETISNYREKKCPVDRAYRVLDTISFTRDFLDSPRPTSRYNNGRRSSREYTSRSSRDVPSRSSRYSY